MMHVLNNLQCNNDVEVVSAVQRNLVEFGKDMVDILVKCGANSLIFLHILQYLHTYFMAHIVVSF